MTVEFRLENRRRRRWTTCAMPFRASGRPAGRPEDPVVSKVESGRAPILTYTVASTRMDEEALSWFVDNTVTKALLGVRGVGAGHARWRRDARGARRIDPARCWP